MVLKSKSILPFLLIFLVLLSSCMEEGIQALEDSNSSDEEDLLEAISSPIPERTLSICLGDEPDSLFLYGDQSTSASIIRQAIYDTPVDKVNFLYSSALLEEIPSQENGLVVVVPVEVYPGDKIVDSKGNLTILASGVEYRPSECSAPECLKTFQNQAPVVLDQVEIRFPLKAGINWADGTPLTAIDSEFSYWVARDLYGSGGPRKTKYTASYTIEDEKIILWKGVPGFLGIYSYPEYFFPPLPQHLLADLTLEEVRNSERTSRQPLSWGPYRITEWIPGDHISLVKNENYHLNSEGLPAFDSLVFRFVDGGEEALAAYFSGECEVVANEPGLFDFLSEIEVREQEGDLNIVYIEGYAWEQLSFGINSLDSNQDLLRDPGTRQAISQCINREVISSARGDAGSVIGNFYLPGDPRIKTQSTGTPYQPGDAIALLEEIGWIDHDQDPDTPRIAQNVEDIRDGTPFQLSLLTADLDGLPRSAELIQEDLKTCGIDVKVELLPASELLAPGPEGPIFGRQFDLALFAWATGNYHPCRLFLSDEIPGNYPVYPKGWGGVNAPGYSSDSFDAACDLILTSLPDSPGVQEAVERLTSLFEEDLPVLPLFFRRQIIVTGSELSGFENGIYDLFWNIEILQ
ncbi:MAG: ABC transporter substrate-binding protein [Anaerolineales bacterium]|nr:ABC transporter substrate-binding protein [Anaerolineales bacterium]